ncbi:MAG: hypothetical protein ACJ790_07475 [Myxococcaceae bacterium]
MSLRLKRPAIEAVIGFAVALGCALTAYAHFGPWTKAANFNSDSLIPVLMANAGGFSRFDLYYWGQDRFGALPFLIARLFRGATGFVWTPEALALVQAFAALSSAWFFSRLLRPRLLWAALACGAVLVASTAAFFFNISQPYGWQLPSLLLAWWALRTIRTTEHGLVRATLLATLTGFLACWQSALSGPILLAIAIAEGLSVPLVKWRRTAAVIASVLVGGGLEGALRGVFQVYAKQEFGHSYRTDVHLWPKGAYDAFRSIVWSDLGPGPLLTALTLIVGLFALGFVLIRWLRRDAREVDERVTVLAALGFAFAVQLFLISLGSHFRENRLDARYFALMEWMALMSSAVFVHWAVDRILAPRIKLALPYAVAGIVSFAPLWAARAVGDPALDDAREVAEALAAKAPGAFLVSGYWETYVVAGLAKPGELLPLTSHDQYMRTPFLKEPMRAAKLVWVAKGGLGEGDPMPHTDSPLLYEADTLLERRSEPSLEIHDREFFPYRPATDRVLTKTRPRGCPEKATVELAPTPGAELHLAHAPGIAIAFQVTAFDADGKPVAVKQFNAVDNLVSFAAAKERPTARFEISIPHEEHGCGLSEAIVARPQQSSSSESADGVAP